MTQAEDKLVFVPGMGWYLDAQDYLYRGSDQGLGDKIAKFLQDRVITFVLISNIGVHGANPCRALKRPSSHMSIS